MIVSPYRAVYEQLNHDMHYPWRVLCTAIMLESANNVNAEAVCDEFFQLVESPFAMLEVSKEVLEPVLRPLGQHNRRYRTLYRMSCDYLDKKPLRQLYGVSAFAKDCISLFVEGNLTEPRSKDSDLRNYHAWRRYGGPPVCWAFHNWLVWLRTE